MTTLTTHQKNTSRRDRKLYADYQKLLQPGVKKLAVEAVLVKKYRISAATVQRIIRKKESQPQ